LILFGVALACAITLGSPILARFVSIPEELFLAAAVGVPFGLALPLLLGELQGEQRFFALSLLLIGQAGVKLLAAIGLGLVFGPLGVIAGISFASIAIYLCAWRLLRRRLAIRVHLPWLRPAAKYLAIVLPSTLALSVLLSADVLVVKHFFTTRVAGEYAVVAAIGRAIFWGASGVATVLFPKITFHGARGRSSRPLVGASLLIVASGGIVGLTLITHGARWVLSAFAGSAYVEAAFLLPWYAIGMILLGAAAVLIATHQSRGKAGFLVALMPLTALELVLLLLFHQNPLQVVQVVDIAMATVAGALAAAYLAQDRTSRSHDSLVVSSGPAASNVAGIG
jgi:O-antigen/teichoic acid export membrane protein